VSIIITNILKRAGSHALPNFLEL